MKYLFFSFVLICLSIFLVGCGHNGFIYQNADVWNFGYNQQTQQIGLQRFNGELLTGGSRENTSIEASLTDESDIKPGFKRGRIKSIKYSTGIQINGYTVDLAKANPEIAAKLLQEMQNSGKTTKYFLIKDNKLIEVSKDEYEKETSSKAELNGKDQTITIKNN